MLTFEDFDYIQNISCYSTYPYQNIYGIYNYKKKFWCL